MRRTVDPPQLPTAAQLTELARLAEAFADEIKQPPYDLSSGAWKHSKLLSPDDPARIELPVPMRRRQGTGLLGLLGQDEVDLGRDEVRRVEQERRLRAALRSQFHIALLANVACKQLRTSKEFLELLNSFTREQRRSKKDSPINAPDAQARFISLLARELAWLQDAGQRAVSAGARTRQRAARLIDTLLDLRDEGVSLPLIGFVNDKNGARLAFLDGELERWRVQLLKPPPAGRKRWPRNDPHLGRRQARSAFHAVIEMTFGSLLLADALAERFDALIGYRNPAAQASR